jgi:hypothetical protein
MTTSTTLHRRFGRRIRFDPRSRAWPLREILPDKPIRSYTWRCAACLDQGQEGSCVGHGVAHELIAGVALAGSLLYLVEGAFRVLGFGSFNL